MNQESFSASAGQRVLVVDDDVFSQEFLAEMLTELGISEVLRASNGREALRSLANLPQAPALLICDVYMPDMDGIEFLDQLAKQAYAGGVMLISGEDVQMLDIALQVAKANGLDLVGAYTKPVAMEVLADTMVRIANRPV